MFTACSGTAAFSAGAACSVGARSVTAGTVVSSGAIVSTVAAVSSGAASGSAVSSVAASSRSAALTAGFVSALRRLFGRIGKVPPLNGFLRRISGFILYHKGDGISFCYRKRIGGAKAAAAVRGKRSLRQTAFRVRSCYRNGNGGFAHAAGVPGHRRNHRRRGIDAVYRNGRTDALSLPVGGGHRVGTVLRDTHFAILPA